MLSGSNVRVMTGVKVRSSLSGLSLLLTLSKQDMIWCWLQIWVAAPSHMMWFVECLIVLSRT